MTVGKAIYLEPVLLATFLFPLVFFDEKRQIFALSSLSVLAFFIVQIANDVLYVLPTGEYNLDIINYHFNLVTVSVWVYR